jgi:hypothetical protein
VEVTARKAHAGSEVIEGVRLIDSVAFSDVMWSYVRNQIMAWEMVKVVKAERRKDVFLNWPDRE